MFLIHILYCSRHRFLSVLHFKYPKFDDIEIERKHMLYKIIKDIVLAFFNVLGQENGPDQKALMYTLHVVHESSLAYR